MNSVNHHKENENENVSKVVWETQDYSARKFKTRKTPPIAAQREAGQHWSICKQLRSPSCNMLVCGMQVCIPKKKSQGEKRKEEKRKTKSVRSDSFSSCYFCLNNFISALFPDKTKLSLTYHLAKHWSLKDEPSSFQLSASLRLWCFPQMGFRTQTIITNTPPTSVTALSTIFEARKFLGSYWECPWLLCRVVRLKIKSK